MHDAWRSHKCASSLVFMGRRPSADAGVVLEMQRRHSQGSATIAKIVWLRMPCARGHATSFDIQGGLREVFWAGRLVLG